MLALVLSLSLTADPTATVERLYAAYKTPVEPKLREFLSASTGAAWDKGEKRAHAEDFDGVAPMFEFDLVVQAQDYKITKLRVTSDNAKGKKRTVTATFDNMGRKTIVRYVMVEETDGWKIEDITGVEPKSKSLLALIDETVKL